MKVFYHVARMGNWEEVVIEQLGLLGEVGLTNVSVTVSGGGEETMDWIAWIASAFSITVERVSCLPCLTCYEFPAMVAISEWAKGAGDEPVMYLHSKGVSRPDDPNRQRWRRVMHEQVVVPWRDHVEAVRAEYDTVGFNWHPRWVYPHYSGNFWVTTARYIRRCVPWAEWVEGPVTGISPEGERIAAEFWIGSGKPRAKTVGCESLPIPGDPSILERYYEGKD